MEFILFLSKIDKDILDLLIKANYVVEENKIECLLNKEIKGLHNFKMNKIIICTENAKRKTNYKIAKNNTSRVNFKTERVIRKALRHEATHAAQKCNNNKTLNNTNYLENKLHQSKRKALNFSTSNFAGNYRKELEAYILEDKPRRVKEILKKYCL